MRNVLRLVVRRIVVGNLGTGNIERRLGEAARKIRVAQSWRDALDELADLNPPVEEFVARAAFRSFNKSSLEFLRRSEIQHSITPEPIGTLHFIRPRQATQWDSFPQDDFAFWGATLGNTLISHSARRPKGALSWIGAKNAFLPDVLDLDAAELSNSSEWSTDDVEKRGAELAQRLGEVWYLDAE